MTTPLSWKLVNADALQEAVNKLSAMARSFEDAFPEANNTLIMMREWEAEARRQLLTPSAPTEALKGLLDAAKWEAGFHDEGEPCECRFCSALRAFTLATSESGKEKET